jgi:hypothetical protein
MSVGISRIVELRNCVMKDIWLPLKHIEIGLSSKFPIITKKEYDLNVKGRIL